MADKIDVYEEALRKNKCEFLYNELLKYQKKGIRISVRGNYFPIRTCAEIMSVNEGGYYMPDMIENSDGRIVEINYDIVARF